ncbi:MAG: histidine phosphatase family protein [Kiritimatiellae bacterium]|nr:histidine phosphatase family protein [Kiritimatiellia bacterium]
MRLFLVRHGAYRAEYTSKLGPGLSPHGEAQAQAVGTYLKSQKAQPDVVITSGYLRARETADWIMKTLDLPYDPIETHDFAPDGDPETMRAILEALDARDILVVGHMCSIGELARHLNLQAPTLFDTCTVMAFEKIDNRWKFLWFNDCGRNLL